VRLEADIGEGRGRGRAAIRTASVFGRRSATPFPERSSIYMAEYIGEYCMLSICNTSFDCPRARLNIALAYEKR
jgi:hypothetical protein